jgi:hypothetical protein
VNPSISFFGVLANPAILFAVMMLIGLCTLLPQSGRCGSPTKPEREIKPIGLLTNQFECVMISLRSRPGTFAGRLQ